MAKAQVNERSRLYELIDMGELDAERAAMRANKSLEKVTSKLELIEGERDLYQMKNKSNAQRANRLEADV